MRTIHLSVDGMRCRRCVREATALLRDVPGVTTVVADSSSGRLAVTGDVTAEAVLAALASTTFTVRIQSPPTAPIPAPPVE